MAIKGEKGILYIYQTTWKPLACLTSNGLNSAVSVIESQTKCFPGVVKKTAGAFTYSIDMDGEYIDTSSAGGDTAKQSHDALFLLQQAKTLVEWKLVTNTDDANLIDYYGFGLITDLSLTQGAGDEVSTFSATIDGDGAITLTDPHVV